MTSLDSRIFIALLLAGSAFAAPTAPTAPTALATLASLDTPAAATQRMIGAPPGCRDGFVAQAASVATRPAPVPSRGGVSFSDDDIARWKRDAEPRPVAGSRAELSNGAGDWARIRANAERFRSAGEDAVSDRDHQRGSHGMNARDAAFVARLWGDERLANAVRDYLLSAAKSAKNDFSGLCFREPDASAPFDAYFEQAAWLLRYIVTYDYVRTSVPDPDRLVVENFIRRQAYFFAAHLDWGLRMAFPNRLAGDYQVRQLDARPRTAADAYAVKRFDTSGNCTVGPEDDPAAYPVFAYVDGEGNNGPRLSRLSLWFNNRRSAAVVAFGTAGLLLDDGVLVNRAKRYVMEWLTYSVWPDGSEGEYFRNGDYCIARQGLIYAQYNIQAAALLAHWLRLAGDPSLALFSTTAGLFGTESPSGQSKSIASVIRTELQLVGGELHRYYHEGWKEKQMPRDATNLGHIDSRYMNSGRAIDNHHVLGLLLAESTFQELPIAPALLRDASSGIARANGQKGQQGPRIATGYGQWQDVFGALPAVLALH